MYTAGGGGGGNLPSYATECVEVTTDRVCFQFARGVWRYRLTEVMFQIIITEIQFSGYEEPLGIARYVVKLYRMMFPYNVQFVLKFFRSLA